MLKFLTLSGMTLPIASPAPAVERTPEGLAFGSVPGWSILLDPACSEDGALLNRESGILTESPLTDLALSTFPDGNDAILLDTVNSVVNPNVAFNPPAWSLFAVVRIEQSNIYQRLVATKEANVGAPSPRVGFEETGAFFSMLNYQQGDTVARYDPPVSFVGRTALVMATFSVRDGVRLFENGAMVARNEAYKTPVEAAYGPGEWRFFPGMRGLVGMVGMLHIDLGWPEHAGYRRAIERFLMDKYGIS